MRGLAPHRRSARRADWLRAAALGLLIGGGGAAFMSSPPGLAFEESLGLSWLFLIRGPIQPPADVAVVSLDKRSAEAARSSFTSPALAAAGAGAGDRRGRPRLILSERSTPAQDVATAIAEAGRVVLFQQVERRREPLTIGATEPREGLWSERTRPPIPELAAAAAAAAPFPLPKLGAGVRQFWAFKREAGDLPTLPAVALQLHALDAYQQWINALEAEEVLEVGQVPFLAGGLRGALAEVMRATRAAYRSTTALAEAASLQPPSDAAEPAPAAGRRADPHAAAAIASLYGGPDSHYLNFYGPPGTIPVIPVARLLAAGGGGEANVDLNGKIVFVGVAELDDPGQPDGFYSVFTRPDGVDLSGVEIAACLCQHADDAHHRARFGGHCRGAAGWSRRGRRHGRGAAAGAGGGALGSGRRRPVCPCRPGNLQPGRPVATAGNAASLAGAPGAVPRGSRPVRAGAAPAPMDDPGDQLLPAGEGCGRPPRRGGHCARRPRRDRLCHLPRLGSREFHVHRRDDDARGGGPLPQCIFRPIAEPIKRHGADVLEFRADGIMCAWTASETLDGVHAKACEAALDMIAAVHSFGADEGRRQLPTRIGIHAGRIFVGHAGGGGRYAYSIIGDIANTASRIEGLNKLIGTSLLVSDAVAAPLAGFLLRPVGRFRLRGKLSPIGVVEVIARRADAPAGAANLCARFAAALAAYHAECWQEAAAAFTALAEDYPLDGPTAFYQHRCQSLLEAPSVDADMATIRIETK